MEAAGGNLPAGRFFSEGAIREKVVSDNRLNKQQLQKLHGMKFELQ